MFFSNYVFNCVTMEPKNTRLPCVLGADCNSKSLPYATSWLKTNVQQEIPPVNQMCHFESKLEVLLIRNNSCWVVSPKLARVTRGQLMYNMRRGLSGDSATRYCMLASLRRGDMAIYL